MYEEKNFLLKTKLEISAHFAIKIVFIIIDWTIKNTMTNKKDNKFSGRTAKRGLDPLSHKENNFFS